MTPEAMAALHGRHFPRGWSAAEMARLCEEPSCCVVCAPSGFAIARHVLDEAELLTIVVEATAQGQGVATHLLQDLIVALKSRGITTCHLEVAQDNTPARALYGRFGFVEAGRRRGYYPRPDGAMDALLMRKAI